MNSILTKETTLLDRLATYTGLEDAEGHPIHNLHPYPAKYIPKLPREIISEHLNERHTLLDPFCGSGTSLVEAALARVRSVGVDSNPIACLISKAKTVPLSPAELDLGRQFRQHLRVVSASTLPKKYPVPDYPRLNLWFQRNVQKELSWLLANIQAVQSERLKTLLLSVFSSIITSVSNQDSETRYTAVEKGHPDGYVLSRFERRLSRALEAAADWASACKQDRTPIVYNCSVDRIHSGMLADDSIDLIVTSPPYPNSFDYYLYHKLRMVWLGYDVATAQADEIGSRHEHSSKKAPIDTFISRMRPVMSQLARVLKPSKLAYFFVGDSVLGGRVIDMAEIYGDLAQAAGFRVLDERAYDLTLVSRSFRDTREAAGHAQKQRKMQRVLLLEGRKLGTKGSSVRAVATPVAKNLPVELRGIPSKGSTIAIRSDDTDRHVHSLIPYPSKFIPEIPRWAISQFSKSGDRVLDPFAGSATSAVEALISGRHSVSVDVSPWAALVARAKTTRCDPASLREAAELLAQILERPSKLPRTKPVRFDLENFWFNPEHLSEFAGIQKFIRKELPAELQDFFRVALASTIRTFSYQDPAQLKVKRDPRKVAAGTQSPSALLAKRLPNFVERLCRFNELADHQVQNSIIAASIGDWISEQPTDDLFDLLVTSPPYINAMNYAMTSRYELLLLGLVDPEQINRHQQDYYGTERVYAKNYRHLHQFDSSWSNAKELNGVVARIYDQEPKRAFVVYDYFVRMREAFSKTLPRMKRGGRVVVVTGTNTIRKVPVDTHRYLKESLQDLGATLECEFHYEIIKQRLKITRHDTAALIPHDGVAVLRWDK